MASTEIPRLTVSDFIAVTNQTLEYSFPGVEVEGEIASFKVNQNKYVFFDIKDETGSVGCFMTIWQLRQPLEDGMKVIVTVSPKLTQWGKFSLTVRAVRLSGEGSLKRGFELLKAKLEQEGLFKEERKRSLPAMPKHIAVISSTEAAGYADFTKILNDRWGGVKVDVAHVQVQGSSAPDQMIRAIRYFNAREILPEVIVLIRGGGSADDLSAFNDELLAREIAASRVPTLVGVGHEVDVSLADLVADVRAATPSNAAQIIVPDRQEVIRGVKLLVRSLFPRVVRSIDQRQSYVYEQLRQITSLLDHQLITITREVQYRRQVLVQLDPHRVLARGYAIVSGNVIPGSEVKIEKSTIIAVAEVKNVRHKE